MKLNIVPIETDERFSFAFSKGASDILAVCFSGVGTTRAGMPPFELVKVASGNGAHSVLFISDKTRSWMSATGLQELIVEHIERLKKQLGVTRVVAIGNSMGGFMALTISRVTPVETTIAFTPQFSVDPEIVPEEIRWKYFRNQIEEFSPRCVEDLPVEGTQHFVFHGGERGEYIHWSQFPVQENLRHYLFPKMDHNIAAALKGKNLLMPLVDACISQRARVVLKQVQKAGGSWRNQSTLIQSRTEFKYQTQEGAR